ncbi:MAG: hypothetical protein P1U36_00955 [Legionellaceae bacterium]|nr:hypothetical protein [Legionellaceae bacterium]
MERKIPYTLSLLSLFIAYSSTYAGTEGQTPDYPNGFMLGAGAGLTEFMDSGAYSTSTRNVLSSTTNRSFRFGFMGDVTAGYGRRVYQPFYLGTELGLNIFGTRKTSSSYSTDTAMTVEDSVFDVSVITEEALSTTTTVSGNVFVPFFDIKPGLLVTPKSLLFARIGVNYNQFNVVTQSSHLASGTVINAGATESGTALSGLYSSEKKQRAGLRTGLGFEYLISDHVGLAANYVYSFYSSVNTHATGVSSSEACDVFEGCHVNGDGTYVASGKSKVSDQQALLQLIYHLT